MLEPNVLKENEVTPDDVARGTENNFHKVSANLGHHHFCHYMPLNNPHSHIPTDYIQLFIFISTKHIPNDHAPI